VAEFKEELHYAHAVEDFISRALRESQRVIYEATAEAHKREMGVTVEQKWEGLTFTVEARPDITVPSGEIHWKETAWCTNGRS